MELTERPVRGGTIVVARDAQALARLAAARFHAVGAQAVRRAGRFMVALAGGSTPRALYEELAREAPSVGGPGAVAGVLDWTRAHVFWGDERCVPPEHPDSNYRMAAETLLSEVPIPADHVHRMRGEEVDPERAAALYAAEIRDAFAAAPAEMPRFDLVLLGLGPDAHTASLFPGSPAIAETSRLTAAPYVEKLGAHRITLTPPLLNAAAQVLFLVSGKSKAAPLRDVLEGEIRPALRPAQCIRPHAGALLWLVDEDAASLLGA